jgi:ABC-type branched-subunit amino acid transport system substrate-binding protein
LAIACLLLVAACSSTSKSGHNARAGTQATTASSELGAGIAAPGESPIASPYAAVTSTTERKRSGATATTTPPPDRSTVIRSATNLKGGRITIGVHFSTDLTAVFTAFGAQPPPSDARPVVLAIIDWINKNGGIGGKAVDAVLHETNPTNGSFDSQAQLACTDFTEDHKVSFVVGGAIMPSFGLAECLAKRNVPLVWEYQYLLDQASFDKYPSHLYQPFTIVGDRMRVYVDGLFSQGFFAKGARIGLLRYDTPVHKKFADGVIKPALASHGLKLTSEIAVRSPASAGGAGDTAGQLSNAVLRLRSANVDHLLFVPTGAAMPFIFGPVAESQGYHARYGLNSLDIPVFLAENLPAAQLRDALAVGWTPAADVFGPDTPNKADPAEAQCFKLTRDHRDFSVRFCDGLFFLRTALEGVAGTTPADLRAAVDRLGTRFDSPYTFSTRFGAGRHDGAAAWRPVAYDEGCKCFRYRGAVTPLG